MHRIGGVGGGGRGCLLYDHGSELLKGKKLKGSAKTITYFFGFRRRPFPARSKTHELTELRANRPTRYTINST